VGWIVNFWGGLMLADASPAWRTNQRASNMVWLYVVD